MRLGDFNISFKGGIERVENIDKRQAPSSRVVTKIVRRQLIRQTEDIQKWRNATQSAESVMNPDRALLIRAYRDITIDAHLTSVMNTLRLKVMQTDWLVVDENDVINEEETKKLKMPWFKEFVRHTVDAKFYGHSLIQLGSIKDDAFTSIELVPREFVIPEKKLVKHEIFNTQDGTPYDENPYKRWVVAVGEDGDLGLLHKAAPWALWKKNTAGAWSEFSEMFGMPLRVGKTDIRDPANLSNMDDMLKNMGSAGYAVLDNDDMIEFVEQTRQDAHRVFDELIERANSEMSKLILGQTMTTDDGSSRSQAEVHEGIMQDVVQGCKWFVASHVTELLFPIMVMHGMFKPGLRLKPDNTEKLTLKEQFDMIVDLVKTDKYKVPEAHITETFGIPFEEFEAIVNDPDPRSVEAKLDTVMNDVHKMYADMQAKHVH